MIRNIIKSIINISIILVLLSSIASAADNTQAEFHEYKNILKNNPDIFPSRTSGLIVVSNSANFEDNNAIRAFTIIDENFFKVYDLNGYYEIVKVSDLHAYDVHVFWADQSIPEFLDTSGSLNSNWNEFEA